MATIYPGALVAPSYRIEGPRTYDSKGGTLVPNQYKGLKAGIVRRVWMGLNTSDFKAISFKRIPRERVLNQLVRNGADIR